MSPGRAVKPEFNKNLTFFTFFNVLILIFKILKIKNILKNYHYCSKHSLQVEHEIRLLGFWSAHA
jgi:hypothetical protein